MPVLIPDEFMPLIDILHDQYGIDTTECMHFIAHTSDADTDEDTVLAVRQCNVLYYYLFQWAKEYPDAFDDIDDQMISMRIFFKKVLEAAKPIELKHNKLGEWKEHISGKHHFWDEITISAPQEVTDRNSLAVSDYYGELPQLSLTNKAWQTAFHTWIHTLGFDAAVGAASYFIIPGHELPWRLLTEEEQERRRAKDLSSRPKKKSTKRRKRN